MKIVIYCLTCDPFRRNFMEQQFIKHNTEYNFFEAIKFQSLVNYRHIVAPIQNEDDKKFLTQFKNVETPKRLSASEISISMGHYFITKKFIESDNDVLIFCEDDVVFMDSDIKKTVSEYVERENILNKPFIIYGCIIRDSKEKGKVPDLHRLIKTGPGYGNPCYIINKKYARLILDNFSPITTAYDDYLRKLARNNGVLCYYTAPFLCYELSSHYYGMYHTPEDIITKKKITRQSGNNIDEKRYQDVKYFSLSDNTEDASQWKSLCEYILKNKKRGNYTQTIDTNTEHLLFGGSLKNCTSKSIICGSGIDSQTDKIVEPFLIISCRGPLTRQKIRSSGYYCPQNYGDPALLISHYYPMPEIPKENKTHRICIVTSNDNNLSALMKEQCMILDFNNGDISQLIENMLKCEYVLSDSLYGIIIAHSYGLPAVWISHNEFDTVKDTIEFVDYYQSLNILNAMCVHLDDGLINGISEMITIYPNPTKEKITTMINNIRKWTP